MPGIKDLCSKLDQMKEKEVIILNLRGIVIKKGHYIFISGGKMLKKPGLNFAVDFQGINFGGR